MSTIVRARTSWVFIDFITEKFIISECHQESIFEVLSIVKESIRDIGSVLLVMTPLDDPIPLWRVWCLFEKYSAIDVQADMHIAFPFFQREAFRTVIGGTSTPLWMFYIVQLDGRAEASEAKTKCTNFTVVEWRCRTVVSSLQR